MALRSPCLILFARNTVKVKVTILTPTHIGNGQEIGKAGYFVAENKVHIIDMERFIADNYFSQPQNLELLLSTIRNGKTLPENLRKLARNYLRYSLPVISSDRNITQNIKEFIKTAGKVYIPGSSLKGAILTAVSNILVGSQKVDWPVQDDELRDSIGKNFGGADRFFRWLEVSDSNPLEPEKSLAVVKAKLMRTRKDKFSELPLPYEVLKPGIQLTFGLSAHGKFPEQEKPEIKREEEEYLRSIINYLKEYSKQLANAMKLKTEQNVIYLKLGQGSGVWSTSLLVAAKILNKTDYKIKRYVPRLQNSPPITIKDGPWTVKKVDNHTMGWVKLELVT